MLRTLRTLLRKFSWKFFRNLLRKILRKRRKSWRTSTPGRNRTLSRGSDCVSRLPNWTRTRILDQVKAQKVEELAQEYARREPEAIRLVDELLASSGRTIHDLVLEALPRDLDEIERIDRLISVAETRRNISLREIDRRRTVL